MYFPDCYITCPPSKKSVNRYDSLSVPICKIVHCITLNHREQSQNQVDRLISQIVALRVPNIDGGGCCHLIKWVDSPWDDQVIHVRFPSKVVSEQRAFSMNSLTSVIWFESPSMSYVYQLIHCPTLNFKLFVTDSGHQTDCGEGALQVHSATTNVNDSLLFDTNKCMLLLYVWSSSVSKTSFRNADGGMTMTSNILNRYCAREYRYIIQL